MSMAYMPRTAASLENPLDELLEKGVKRWLGFWHNCAERGMMSACYSGDGCGSCFRSSEGLSAISSRNWWPQQKALRYTHEFWSQGRRLRGHDLSDWLFHFLLIIFIFSKVRFCEREWET